MVDKPFIIPQPIKPVGPKASPARKKPEESLRPSFYETLQQELKQAEGVKFSRHALERLEARKISLEKEHLARLNEAVLKAQDKGCKDSLILLDDLAFVVSIKNRTVITAVDGDNRKENVFTNIDSAVIN